MKKLIFAILLAAILWTVMFSPLTAPHVNFWLMMTCSAVLLGGLSTWFNPGWMHRVKWSVPNVLLGVLIAAVLWGIFWTGDKVSSLLFDFARPQVNAIYGIREGESPWLLSVLMLFLIGPAEEIFWRGYVQQTLSSRWEKTCGSRGRNSAFALTALLYALVHAASCNFMLVMAALVAGIVWGLLYRFFPGRLSSIIISHALWDAAVFVWFPI